MIRLEAKVYERDIKKVQSKLEKVGKDFILETMRLVGQGSWIIAREAKLIHSPHVKTGTLMRSIHVAHPDIDHSRDFERARSGEELRVSEVLMKGLKFLSEVGSWIHYAYIHESRFPYLYPAFLRKWEEFVNFIKNGWKKILEKYK